MTLIDAVILGVLQGLTEFLPISSSGHLILAESLLKLNVQDLLSFDVAVHFGTLLAIFIYFRKDFKNLVTVFFQWGLKMFGVQRNLHFSDEQKKQLEMIRFLVIGTIPAVVVGLFFSDFLEEHFRQPFTVSLLMIAVGVFFFFAEYVASKKDHKGLDQVNTFVVGVAQAVALFPGVSRSGATISAGLVQGLKREEAARFSFLLGSVAISAATILSIYKVYKGSLVLPSYEILTTGILTSFISGYAAVSFLMQYLKKHTLHVFGVYRVVLGFVLLFLLNYTHIFG